MRYWRHSSDTWSCGCSGGAGAVGADPLRCPEPSDAHHRTTIVPVISEPCTAQLYWYVPARTSTAVHRAVVLVRAGHGERDGIGPAPREGPAAREARRPN